MKKRVVSALAAFAGCLLVSSAAQAALIVNAPVDVVGNLASGQFAANGYGTQSYKDWGNEPFIAVNPLNPSNMVISSIVNTTGSTTSGATIFYSNNGGSVWNSEPTVPAPATNVFVPNNWTFAYDNSGQLHGTVLGCGFGCDVYSGTTSDPTSLAAWSYANGGSPINTPRGNGDQPWISVSGHRVYVAYDDFTGGVQERVAVSNDGGTTFTVDNPISNLVQPGATNPGTRIATDGAGNVYSIFTVGSPTATPGVQNVTYYLNRSRDGGVTWDFAGNSTIGGIEVDSGVSTQLCNTCTQSSNNWFAGVNDLRGGVDAIATDSSGTHIYVLIGKKDGAGTDRVYLATYQVSGAGLVKTSEIAVSPAGQQAAMPSLTVTANGSVVVEYETYDAAHNMVIVHVGQSSDFGASMVSDDAIYSFTPLSLAQATGFTDTNREFGDFLYLTSIGNTFYGTFAGLGNMNSAGIDTTGLIDPFFFTGTASIADAAVPEAGSLMLFLPALLGMFWLGRRRFNPARAFPGSGCSSGPASA